MGQFAGGILDRALDAIGEFGVATAQDDERRQAEGRENQQQLHWGAPRS